jgi:hypothetical protein
MIPKPFLLSLWAFGLCLSNVVHGAPTASSYPSDTFSEVTIYTPLANYTSPGVLYARTAQLADGSILATWENYSPEPPLVYFPIYRSTDGGRTWKEYSRVTDQKNNWGLRYQPFLYVLPTRIGQFPEGTVLLSGNSIPTNLSNTQIDLYASFNQGKSWRFVSSVVSGGEAIPDNGLTPVWEPFLMVYKNQLVTYYSDQGDPLYGQKLAHKVSSDLVNWGEAVNDVTYDVYTARPGMTTVTHLPNGKYLMTYEYGGGPGFSSYAFPVYYRISDSPLTFDSAEGYPVIASDGTQPTSSPYVTWSPVGGRNGTIIVSSGTYSDIFINQALGAVDAWVKVATPESVSYTRSLRVLQNPNLLLISGAGLLPPSANNSVTVSVVDLSKLV